MSLSCSRTRLHQIPPLMCFHMIGQFCKIPQSLECATSMKSKSSL